MLKPELHNFLTRSGCTPTGNRYVSRRCDDSVIEQMQLRGAKKMMLIEETYGDECVEVKHIEVTSITPSIPITAQEIMVVTFRMQCPCCDRWIQGRVERKTD